VDGGFELDDIYYTAYRKGEVNPKKLKLEDQEKFIEGKKSRTFTILQQLGLGVCNS
jgi:hypothetical protein